MRTESKMRERGIFSQGEVSKNNKFNNIGR